jgi:succinate dehydrogenase / fumarate reductase flavoprotein subunit
VPRDVAARAAKKACDEGRGIAYNGRGVYLDFGTAIRRDGRPAIEERYGNLFEMYERITGDDPYKTPMRIYPASHYTMGGLWVDYNLMSNVPGLFVIGEANFSDHGANRLGASALMQGLADGYFILPYTIGHYLAQHPNRSKDTDWSEFDEAENVAKARLNKLLNVKGKRSIDSFHRELGLLIWDYCGMARNGDGLKKALARVPELREEFWENVSVPGSDKGLNQSLEKAGRVADFLEFAEVMLTDALDRDESCGGHFREEHQTEDGEARRNDEDFSYVAAWEFKGVGNKPQLHKEELTFDYVPPTQRSYK